MVPSCSELGHLVLTVLTWRCAPPSLHTLLFLQIRSAPPHPHPCLQIFDEPGNADLSAWVDFDALRQAALDSGAPVAVHGPVSQAHFLTSMGLNARLQQLLKVGKGHRGEGSPGGAG